MAGEHGGLNKAKIAKKMRKIGLKQVLVRLKKILIIPVGENFLTGYKVDEIGATALRPNEFGLGPIGAL